MQNINLVSYMVDGDVQSSTELNFVEIAMV